MQETKTDKSLAQAFARLSKAAARKKIYSRKASKEGRPEVAHFIRAMAASEAIQARRLFNSLIGKVDTSDEYLTTVFEKEVDGILEKYSALIDDATEDRPALIHALSQLRAAQRILRSFYDPESRDVNIKKNTDYFVCHFCGYLNTGSRPEKCPICGASQEAFDEVD